MKKIFSAALSLLLIVTALSGCSDDRTTNSDDAKITDTTNESTTETLEEDITEEITTEPEEDAVPEEQLYRYNKYLISADSREYYTGREYTLYCKMIDSILAYDGKVSGFNSYDEFFKVWSFLLSDFVPVRNIILTYINSDEPFEYENGTATLKFAYDKETCTQNYMAYENIMNEALSLIKESDSDWEKIAKLYIYVSDNMTYGNPYETYGVNVDTYSCIVYKLGMCTGYTSYLNMLAEQIGFETIIGRSQGKDGFEGADHAWSMIRVDGKWYNFDACWQSPHSTYENMNYFAFDTEFRYRSLASNNPWGMVGEVEMFDLHSHKNERKELPLCDEKMSETERKRLYLSVIDEYNTVVSKYIQGDIDEYVAGAYKEILPDVMAGINIGIYFEIKSGVLNSNVRDLILNYSPQDLARYPEFNNEAEKCKFVSIILLHPDQSNLKDLMYCIINEGIVKQQSVKFVVE